MLGISKEFFENYMSSELGRSIAEGAAGRLEDSSFVHKYVFSAEVKQYFNITQEAAAQRIKDYLLPMRTEEISLNPIEGGTERPDLYVPCLALLTYCILVCILTVEKGQFHGHMLTANHFLLLALTACQALTIKLGLSVVGLQRGILELLSHLGYQYILMVLVCLVAGLGWWPLTGAALVLLMAVNFWALDGRLRKQGESLSLPQQTAIKVACGGHVALCLLMLKLTGGL